MRFHFDVVSAGEVIRDEHGVEAADLDEAIEQAIIAVEEMRLTGDLVGAAGWFLVIRDAAGRELRRLPI